jgi:hypothetical protein
MHRPERLPLRSVRPGGTRKTAGQKALSGLGLGSLAPWQVSSKPPETGRGRQQPLRFRERWGRIRSKEAKDLPGLKVAICHESNLTAKVTAGTACATSTSALHARRLSRSWRAARRRNGVETDPLDRVRAGRPLVRASWSRWCRCPPGGQTEALALERPTRNPTRSDLGPACIRRNLESTHGRGYDDLPPTVLDPLRRSLVSSLAPEALLEALKAAVDGLLRESVGLGEVAIKAGRSLRE